MPFLGLIIIGFYVLFYVLLGIYACVALWFSFALRWVILNWQSCLKSPVLFGTRLGIPAVLLTVSSLFFYVNFLHQRPPDGVSAVSVIDGSFDMTSPELKPFSAMYTVPRAKYGFTPLPKHASVTISTPTDPKDKSPDYDTELDISDGTGAVSSETRQLYFKRLKKKYFWTGERECWTGPHQWKDAHDEMEHETISIDYQVHPDDRDEPPLDISYWGNDPRLANQARFLTLKDVQPILKEWGAVESG